MDPQTPRDQFPFTNARVARRWRKLLDERLKDLGVTQARWFTMVCLQRGGGGLTQRELAHLMTIGIRRWFACLIASRSRV